MKKIIQNILKTKIYLLLLSLFLIIIFLLSFYLRTIIIPSYESQLITNILNESKRVASHLSNTIDYKNSSLIHLNKIMKRELEDFQIHKVHYFNKYGKVIYSSNKEKIGYLNKHSYFHNIVAKGNVFYKIKTKGDKSFENDDISTDIIEIYLPIMEGSDFIAAFELYYDISNELILFNNLSNKINKTTFFISLFLVFILFGVIFALSKRNLEKEEYEKELKYLADNDVLTNTFNRRYFYNVTKILININQRENKFLSLVLIDIDDFKIINDTYGHQVGDNVLKEIALILKKLIRKSDVLARYGGEEFIIALPNTSRLDAKNLATKLCENIENEKFHEFPELKITISVGISEDRDISLDELVKKADDALYKAKEIGKNRVELFEN